MTGPWERYLQLMEERPGAFTPDPALPIETDPAVVAAYTARTGRSIEVVYESPYHLMVVDLVRTPEGPFPYERVLPAVPQGAVVLAPLWEGKFVLLDQFRHPLRTCQLAFPRGFGEPGLSEEENAQKELGEELGAQVLSLKPLGQIVADSGLSAGGAQAMLCRITQPHPPLQYEGIQGIVCLTPEELGHEIALGQISDGFTLSAYALFRAVERQY